MRRLWIGREKSSAAGFRKMKVYIEDREDGEILISGVPCRKLGTVKNGRQKHFAIEDDAAKVFVLGSRDIGKSYVEYAQVPEGDEDVFLNGRNCSVPFVGKPFRFDGAVDEEVLRIRKRAKRKGALCLIAVILAVLLVGAAVGAAVYMDLFSLVKPAASAAKAESRTFRVDSMEITLTDEFEEDTASVPGYDASFTGPGTAVFVKKEAFSLAEGLGDMTLEGYAAMVLRNNGLEGSVQLQENGGHMAFAYSYTGAESGKPYEAYTVVKKGPDAFWLVQFSSAAEDAQTNRGSFARWADTIAFVSE